MPLADATTKQRRRTRKSIRRSYTRPRTRTRTPRKTVRKKLVDAAVETVAADPRLSLPRAQQEGLADTKTRKRRTKRRKRIAREAERVSRQFGPTSGPDITPRAARAMGDEFRAQRGQRRAERRRDLTPEERAELPGAALRGDAFHDYQLRAAEAEATNQAGLGGALEGIANVMTLGIPFAVREAAEDPSLLTIGGAAAAFIPIKGLSLPFMATRRTTRVLRGGGAEVEVPAALSAAGRLVERGAFGALPKKARATIVGREIAYSQKQAEKLRTAPAKALQRIGKAKSFTAGKQTALRALIENVPIEEQIAFHARKAAAATDAGTRRFNEIWADLYKQASKYVEAAPSGGLRLAKDVPKDLQRAWRLADPQGKTGGVREEILRSLDMLAEETMKNRYNLPGRIVRGATWYSRAGAGEDIRMVEKQLSALMDEVRSGSSESVRKLRSEASKWAGKEDVARGKLERAARIFPDVGKKGKVPAPGTKAYENFLARETRVAEAQQELLVAQTFRSAAMRGAEGRADEAARELERLSESLRTQTDEIAARGDTLVGGESFTAGRGYIPDVRGTPGLPNLSPRSVARQATAVLQGGWRRSFAGRGRDPSLTHTNKGQLKSSGFYRDDVTNLTAEATAKASKLKSLADVRKIIVASGRTAPPAPHELRNFIPVRVDPSKGLPKELKAFWDQWEEVARTGLTKRQLDRFSDEGIDGIIKTMFRSDPDDIANTVWVDKNLFDELVSQSSPMSGRLIPLEGPLRAVDAYNEIVKFGLLYLNPAYPIYNFLGNTAMNLFQQGVFYPANLMKSFRAMRKMTPEGMETIRELMGAGIVQSAATGVRQAVVPAQFVRRVMSDMADTMPRLTAFFHEARAAGYKSWDEIDELLAAGQRGRKDATSTIDKLTRRAKDAIVDYDRLTPFERHVVSRVVFFYPWLRGATRYTAKFPLDHPWLSAAMGYGAYEAKQHQQEKLGNVPWYAQFAIPIPGMEDQQGNPYVIDPQQLLTQTQPLSLAQSAADFLIPGREGTSAPIVESLSPAVGIGIEALTGLDTFTGRVGEPGPEAFINELRESPAPVRLYEALTTPYEEKRDRLYPRTKRDELFRVGLGSLAPKPYNVSVGQGRAKDLRSEKSSAKAEPLKFQRLSQWALDSPEVGPQTKAAVRKWTRMESIIRERTKQKAERQSRNFSDLQGTLTEYTIKLQVLKQVRPNVLNASALKMLKDNWTDPKSQESMKTQINDWIEFADEYDGTRLSNAIESDPVYVGQQGIDQLGF